MMTREKRETHGKGSGSRYKGWSRTWFLYLLSQLTKSGGAGNLSWASWRGGILYIENVGRIRASSYRFLD